MEFRWTKKDADRFSQNIRSRREAMGLSQNEVAINAGITLDQYTQLETKPKRICSSLTVLAIANALLTTVDDLIFGMA